MALKFKMTDSYFDKKKKRHFITLEEKTGPFGLVKNYIDYVDSDYTFTNFKGLRVFYSYPEMHQLNATDPRTKYLTDCLRRIKFEETGEIIE